MMSKVFVVLHNPSYALSDDCIGSYPTVEGVYSSKDKIPERILKSCDYECEEFELDGEAVD